MDGVQEDRVSTIAADVFGEEIIFSPADWEAYRYDICVDIRAIERGVMTTFPCDEWGWYQ